MAALDSATPTKVIVVSPCRKCIDDFDNLSYPDLTFVIPGLDKSLGLSRDTLIKASTMLDVLFREKTGTFCAYDEKARRLEWTYSKTAINEVYRNVLVKWLRFCYGEDQKFSLAECPSALVVLFQLQLKCGDEIREKIKTHMLNAAKCDVELGVDMLLQCAVDNGDSGEMKDISEALAKTLLTRYNMDDKFELIFDCLMKLPAHYLNFAEYGDGHNERGEVNVRVRYIRYHPGLDKESKLAVLRECCGKKISAEEIELLKELELLNNEDLIEMRLKSTEIELQEAIKEMKAMKKTLKEEQRKTRSIYDEPQFNIVKDTDLNTLLAPGTYCCQSGETCATLKNKPLNMKKSAFLMIVRFITSNWWQQEIISNENMRWTRQYQISGNTWTDWLSNSPTVLFNVRYSKDVPYTSGYMIIPFDTVNGLNVNQCFDTTNYRFVAPFTGWYLLYSHIYLKDCSTPFASAIGDHAGCSAYGGAAGLLTGLVQNSSCNSIALCYLKKGQVAVQWWTQKDGRLIYSEHSWFKGVYLGNSYQTL